MIMAAQKVYVAWGRCDVGGPAVPSYKDQCVWECVYKETWGTT